MSTIRLFDEARFTKANMDAKEHRPSCSAGGAASVSPTRLVRVSCVVHGEATGGLRRTIPFSIPTISVTMNPAARMRSHDPAPIGALLNAVFINGV